MKVVDSVDGKRTHFLSPRHPKPTYLTTIECPCPFGEIVNYQRGEFVAYIEDLKQRTGWLEGEDILPHIPNYVTNSALGVPFRLEDIPLHLPNAYYKPEEFAATTIRILQSACLLFQNGKVVITGLRSYNDVKYSIFQYRRQLMQVQQLVKVLNNDGTPMMVTEDEVIQPKPGLGVPIRSRPKVKKQVYANSSLEKLMGFNGFEVVNIVGSGVGSVQPIDLSLLSSIMTTSRTEWDPIHFPGLKFKIRVKYVPLSVPKSTCHIFDSGSVVIMGAKQRSDVDNSFLFVKCVIKNFINTHANHYTITNKFQYRINQINATNLLMECLDDSEKANLELQILEEASTKCFGNYMYEQAQRELEQNPLPLPLKERKRPKSKPRLVTQLNTEVPAPVPAPQEENSSDMVIDISTTDDSERDRIEDNLQKFFGGVQF